MCPATSRTETGQELELELELRLRLRLKLGQELELREKTSADRQVGSPRVFQRNHRNS